VTTLKPMAVKRDQRPEELLMQEVNAIISSPRYGVDEAGHVSLTFEAYTDPHTAAAVRLDPERAKELLLDAQVSDVADLHGYPIRVRTFRDRVEFIGAWTANGLWDRRTVRR
jgi:hypothetical protein